MDESSNGEDEMHRRVGWMVAADVSILHFLNSARDTRDDPSIQTPRTISLNTGYSRQHATNRCKTLAKYGLIDQTGDGQYQLTEYGERAIRQEIPLEELDELTIEE